MTTAQRRQRERVSKVSIDHMNAHLHGDGSIGYCCPCNNYCKEAAAKAYGLVRQAKGKR